MKLLIFIYRTALHIAVVNKNIDIIRLLLSHPNIDIYAKDYIFRDT